MEIMGAPAEVLAEYALKHKVLVKGSAVVASHGYYYPNHTTITDFDLFVSNPLDLALKLGDLPNATTNTQYRPYRVTVHSDEASFDVLQIHSKGSIHQPYLGCTTADCASATLSPDLSLQVEEDGNFQLRFINSAKLLSDSETPRSVRIAVRALWATTLKTMDGKRVPYHFSSDEKKWVKKTARKLWCDPWLNTDSFDKLRILINDHSKELPLEFRYLI